MNITLDGNTNPAYKKIIFTDIPNILSITDDEGLGDAGNYETWEISVTGDLFESVTGNGQYHITLNGDTITNTTDPNNAINKNFYISQSNNATANSIAKALRACPRIASTYDVYQSDLYGNKVVVKAKDVGDKKGTIEHNLTNAYMTTIFRQGGSDSVLNGAKVDVDVFQGDNYITSLEKNFYNGACYFNISPVISTFAEYETTKPFKLKIYSNKNGEITTLKTIDDYEVSVGYIANQGKSVIYYGNLTLAQNVSRGTYTGAYNTMVLYTYNSEINFSVYSDTATTTSFTINYLNSAKETIYTETKSVSLKYGLNDINFYLDNTQFKDAYYIDIELPVGNLRYNVVKPIRAAETYQRILWRNSYGGVSFFDMTGERSESRNFESTTYEKQVFDYYESSRKEQEKLYDRNVEFEVTLKSHLIEKNATYIFNDLIMSKYVYTVINGEAYNIIITGCEITETDTNSIYEVTIKYKYSLPLNA